MKKLLSVLLAAALLALLAMPALAEEHAEEYLGEYFGIELPEEVTLDDFNAALQELGAEPLEGEELTLADATVAAVKLAGMEKLALTYISDVNPGKAAAVLAEYGVEVDEAAQPYVAAAIQMLLVDYDADFAGAVSGEDAASLLYNALEIAGRGRHYIGRISDPNILAELRSVLDSAIIFEEDTLTNLGDEIVLRGATTGYNLKYEGFDARFLQDYTLKYGHSDITHALQLVALLYSEDIDGYIQIEPKVSVYEYMLDWGDPGEPTPTYAVLQVTEDRYLAYAVEYDMMIEFDSIEEKEAFHNVIESYAKKYDSSFDADGNMTAKLIDGAWWQPLYSSTTQMQNEEFELLVDNVVFDATGEYTIHPFSLPENTAAIADVVAEVAPELSVSPIDIYVNPAFYRYITGSDYQ